MEIEQKHTPQHIDAAEQHRLGEHFHNLDRQRLLTQLLALSQAERDRVLKALGL